MEEAGPVEPVDDASFVDEAPDSEVDTFEEFSSLEADEDDPLVPAFPLLGELAAPAALVSTELAEPGDFVATSLSPPGLVLDAVLVPVLLFAV